MTPGTARPFRVGVSASFATDLPGLLEPALEEYFRPFPWVSYETYSDIPVTAAALARFDAAVGNEPRVTAGSFQGGVPTAAIARWGVGFDTIDVEACTEADVLLAITRDAVRKPMAEAIVTLFLALAKRLHAKDGLVRSGQWDLLTRTVGLGMSGRTVGSVGLGNIGAEMFRLLKPFDLGRALAFDPYATPAGAAAVGVELVGLETVFAESDFVAINCPLNGETRGLVRKKHFALMKPTAYFVNTARGAIVDEADLVEALAAGRIAGAGLDVFVEEPLPLHSPLVRMENVILAPHGLGYTDDLVRGNGAGVCESVLAVLRGDVPPYVVNPAVIRRAGFQAKLAGFRQRWEAFAAEGSLRS